MKNSVFIVPFYLVIHSNDNENQNVSDFLDSFIEFIVKLNFFKAASKTRNVSNGLGSAQQGSYPC